MTAGGVTLPFRWLDDFVGVTFQQKPNVEFDADAVFVGHGIVAPEYQWDDYQGVDVRGKVVVFFTGEPPSHDPKFFTGEALTYYGRWTYKFEEATRHGAIGAIIIHTTPTASYGWNVVRSSWSKEELEMKLAPGARAVGFAGWVTKEAGESIAATQNTTADEWLEDGGYARLPGPAAAAAFPHSRLRKNPRDPDPQRHRQSGRQRSAAEERSRDVQRALGSPGRGRSDPRRRDL